MDNTLETLYHVVLDRKVNPQEGSYTCYLFEKGLDKILKKVGEECSETIIAAKNDVPADTVGGDFRSYLPPDGDDGGTGYPVGECDGRVGPPCSKNWKSEANEASG